MIVQRIGIVAIGLLVLSSAVPGSAQHSNLEYQKRVGRYEGIKPKPVAGYDIELLSVRADYTEPAQPMPAELKIRFYLDSPSDAYVYVRELDNKYYYWLDRVQPTAPWGAGFNNVFEWPSSDVIKQLDQMQMYDLGVLVRLGRPEPSAIERVAPAIFYSSSAPARVNGYLFTFRLNGTAHIVATIFEGEKQEPVFRQIYPRKAGGAPFTVRWDASAAPAGLYRLVIGGWFSDTNQPISQTVMFFHQPVVN
ncbi:MAG: hypothetical protein WA400_05530 [Silvibacterium sp.]